MSYPCAIQVLVVEDDSGPKALYERALERLTKRGFVAGVRFARCRAHAEELLSEDVIYHLVILDLRLPEEPGAPEPNDISLGLALLKACECRDRYPVPAILVVSGHLDDAEQTKLQDQLARSFWYGRTLTKGAKLGLTIGHELVSAVRQLHRYGSIGIHIRDGHNGQFPTISPRDEDLLRRNALHQDSVVGLDLSWWSAEYDRSAHGNEGYSGWTKTLRGQYILDKGFGLSTPTYFKLFPRGGAEHVFQAARLMEKKLSHIKVSGDKVSGDRALLATHKVGDAGTESISLGDVLLMPTAEVRAHIPRMIKSIADQTAAIGTQTPDVVSPDALLWEWHDPSQISDQLHRFRPKYGVLGGEETAPLDALASLSANKTPLDVRFASSHHGDLNITNIAVDRSEEGMNAYIFDAGSCTPGVNVRDLATLEVTSLLHQSPPEAIDLVQECSEVYSEEVALRSDIGNSAVCDIARNTIQLISEIRRQALVKAKPEVYAIAVFDQAMIQVGGLAYGLSRNKISTPESAAALMYLVTAWAKRNAPRLFAPADNQ